MIEKSFIKKIMRSIARHGKGPSDNQIMHPVREWFLILTVALLTLIVAIFFCVKLYRHYNSLVPGSNSNNEAPIVIYRAEEIEAALTNIAERKATHDELKSFLTSGIKTPPIVTPINVEPDLSTTTPEEVSPETTSRGPEEVPRPALGGQ